MEKEIPLKFLVGMSVESIGKKDENYLFCDWLCENSNLKAKAKALLPKVRKIAKFMEKAGADLNKYYVFFRNIGSARGDFKFYDAFSICEMDSGKVVYFIAPRNPFGLAELAFEGHGFESDTWAIEFKTFPELLNYFKNIK